MDFALKILNKYGWKEGEGLGKNSNGIAKPLKATLKFDNAGFGSNQAAADFNNHWWERVFNDAASNVDVKQEGEAIKMNLKEDDGGVEISTKGYSVKKLKKAKQQREKEKHSYDNFLQAATLTNLGGELENPNKIDAADIEVTKINVLTDEELFKACGGRTAHKGARHGLKLSGKLARIERQEEELLAKMLAKRSGEEECNKTIKKELPEKKIKEIELKYLEQESQEPQKVKKKKNKHFEETNNFCKSVLEKSENQEKIKKKKRKHREQEIHSDDNTKEIKKHTEIEMYQSTLETEPKKKKKRKLEESYVIVNNIETKIKKKKKNKEVVTLTDESTVMTVDESIVHKKKNSKKKLKNIKED